MHSKLKLLATFFTTLALTAAAIGDEKVLLKQTLETGKTYELEQEMKMNSQISMPGSDETMDQDMMMNMGMELSVTCLLYTSDAADE